MLNRSTATTSPFSKVFCLLISLSCLTILLLIAPISLQAQNVTLNYGTGSFADPRRIRETDSFLIEPPATDAIDPALTLVGVSVRRYQPKSDAPIDSATEADYIDLVSINNLNEWLITLYTEGSGGNGQIQMDDITTADNTQVQAFNLPYSDSDVFRLLFSAKQNLDSDATVTQHNVRDGETKFKLVVDYFYRSPNAVDWRFSSDPYYYQLNTDVYPPTTDIMLNETPGSRDVDGILYNDPNNVFALRALDPIATASGTTILPSGLDQYRYQWFSNQSSTPSANTCANFWASEAPGTETPWEYIPASSLIIPDADGYFRLDEITFPDYSAHAPGYFSLCFQVSDKAGNITSDQGRYWFVAPSQISLDCFDYQSKLDGTCTGAECQVLALSTIQGYGRSTLDTTATTIIEPNVGNTLGCQVETNAPRGYSLQMRVTQDYGDMTHTASEAASYNHTIPPVPATTTNPTAWPVLSSSANWGIRLHELSVGQPLNSNQGSQPFSIYDTRWGYPITDAGDNYDEGNWAGLTTVGQTIFTRNSNLNPSPDHTANSAEDFPVFQFGAETTQNYNAVSGEYVINLIVTAIALD